MTLSASSCGAERRVGGGPGRSSEPQAAVVQWRQLVVAAREGGGGHGVGVGDGQGVGRGVDAGVQRHLGGGGEIAVDHLAVEVDDGDHLGRHRAEVGAGGGHGDEVTLSGRDVARRPDHQSLLRPDGGWRPPRPLVRLPAVGRSCSFPFRQGIAPTSF